MKRTKTTRINWANVLTWTRAALLLPITVFAFLDMRWTVFWLIVIGALTDLLDGPVARMTGVANENGALLDSRIDNVAAAFFFLWLWLLFPVVFEEHLVLVIAAGASVALQVVVAKIKLGIVTGLHLWSNKLAALLSGFTLPAFILFGYSATIVWLVALVTIVSQLEGAVYLLKGGKNLDARFFWDA